MSQRLILIATCEVCGVSIEIPLVTPGQKHRAADDSGASKMVAAHDWYSCDATNFDFCPQHRPDRMAQPYEQLATTVSNPDRPEVA